MEKHTEIIFGCVAQANILASDINHLLYQFPSSLKTSILKQPTLFSCALFNSLENFSFALLQRNEAFDDLFAKLSSLMQETKDIRLLLSCNQLLCEYADLRKETSSFLEIFQSNREHKDRVTDLAPLYLSCEKLCKQTEFFSRRCKEIFSNE